MNTYKSGGASRRFRSCDFRNQTAGSRFATVVVGILLLAVGGWGVTYVPVVRDLVPSLISIEPTTRIALSELDPGAVTLPPGASDACHNIPFLLRPLAGGTAETARLVFTDEGAELGEMRVDCRTGEVLSHTQY